MHDEEPSLLSHLNEVRNQTLPGAGGLSTVIYCGKVQSDGDMTAALQVHREIVEDEVNRGQCNVTGILMGQGTSLLHLLEGPSLSILRILSNLAGHPHFLSKNPIQSGTIAYCVEDRPKQFFTEWYSCTIQERKSQGDEINEENCTAVASDMANRLLAVGSGLQAEAQEQPDLGRYADQLPSKSLILSLASSSLFFGLEEYVRFYFDPYHVQLESEQSWPLERLVNY
eukprot:CAMPEP_0174955146 /NCGR_PEP_ID=MMETSP0004_2-20121128/822_1 /TAXON_ID=420556 /ORGANISM="Ochromonas sp., Strain CCMP1393" /LENGTH=226 /DNA_ID=CAMNT_0016203047 /DNA_START=37 /DNA_END=717 /DNA_ORIENTATION=+